MASRRAAFVASLCVGGMLFCGCGGNQKKGVTVARPGLVPVINVEDDDPKMLAAINKARATTPEFIAALKNPKPGQSGFGVKIPVKDGTQVEHMWMSPVRIVDGQFSGAINNEPLNVKTVKLGDEVKIAPNEISDWMYVEGGKLIGGYTIRMIRDNMPPGERQKFDRSTGLIID